MHLALNPPLGQQPSGRLQRCHHPTESRRPTRPPSGRCPRCPPSPTGRAGTDRRHHPQLSAATSRREPEICELLTRLDDIVGVLDEQRDNIVASIQQLNRVAGTFAGQRDVIDRALKEIPPALDVLIKKRPTLTTALEKLGHFKIGRASCR